MPATFNHDYLASSLRARAIDFHVGLVCRAAKSNRLKVDSYYILLYYEYFQSKINTLRLGKR